MDFPVSIFVMAYTLGLINYWMLYLKIWNLCLYNNVHANSNMGNKSQFLILKRIVHRLWHQTMHVSGICVGFDKKGVQLMLTKCAHGNDLLY